MRLVRPPAVPPGGRLHVVAPCGVIVDQNAVETSAQWLRAQGFEVTLSDQLACCDPDAPYLAGTDAQRAKALHEAFADPEVHAVVCARGGYGAMRLLPLLDADLMAANPKPLIGFSDVTALHGFLATQAGLCSLHGPLMTTLGLHLNPNTPDPHQSALAMRDALLGQGAVDIGALEVIHPGACQGPLFGGNLSLIAAMLGSPWSPDLTGAILFVEEVGEAAYRMDRLLTTLALTGTLGKLAGVVLGDPGFVGDRYLEAQGLGAAVRQRLRTLTEGLNIPVFAGLPVGHRRHNLTMPVGASAQLSCDAHGGRLQAEAATAPI